LVVAIFRLNHVDGDQSIFVKSHHKMIFFHKNHYH